jgi:hypothetical protein
MIHPSYRESKWRLGMRGRFQDQGGLFSSFGRKIGTVEKRGVVAVWRSLGGRVGYDFRGDEQRLSDVGARGTGMNSRLISRPLP